VKEERASRRYVYYAEKEQRMTCIVGLIDGEDVYLGGDSAV